MIFGRSACLRPESLGTRRGEGRGHDGKGVNSVATRVDGDGIGGKACSEESPKIEGSPGRGSFLTAAYPCSTFKLLAF